MANSLPESPSWVDKIFQLETDTPVLGGPNGPDNWQAQQLANRTAYLKLVVDVLNVLITSSGIGAYDSQEKAQAAINNGTETREFFQVWSDKEGGWTEKYQNVGGIATPTGERLISEKGIASLINVYTEVATSIGKVLYQNFNDGINVDPNKIALIGDGSLMPKIIAALHFGRFDVATDISERFMVAIENAARRDALTDGVIDTERLGLILIKDSLGKVILNQMYSGPVRAAYGVWGALGRQTVFNKHVNANIKAKCRAMLAGSPANIRLRFLSTGHSWWDYAESQIAARTQLQAKYGGKGRYISFCPTSGHETPGVTVATSGFTRRNLYTAQAADGTGINGQSIYINAAAGTASITGLTGDRLILMYQDLTGTFNVSVDGGAAISITCGGTNVFVTRTLDVGAGPHTLAIDASGNTGKLNIFGVEDTTASPTGISFISMAQGGARASDYMNRTVANLPDVVAKLNIDAVIITLGTNEVIQSDDVFTFTNNLRSFISAWKNAAPAGLAINYVSAATVNRDRPNYMQYIEAEIAVANEFDIGYIDGYSNMPSRTVMSSLNWYVDTDHPNNAGATAWTSLFIEKLLEI